MGTPPELHLHVDSEPSFCQSQRDSCDDSSEECRCTRKHIKTRTEHCRAYRWLKITIFTSLVLFGDVAATLLGRFYFDKGGKSKWLATLIQLMGFPLLLPCDLCFKADPKKALSTHVPSQSQNFWVLCLLYLTLRLLLAIVSMLYALGMKYLPVYTFSVLIASQLAFNAVFSFFLNSQKFTPFIINSVVVLTLSSILIVFSSDQNPRSSSSSPPHGSKYVLGFICTLGAAAGYSFMLSLTQLSFEKLLKKENFKTMIDVIIYQSLVASCAVLIGLLTTGEWRGLKSEMNEFKTGKRSYIMTLVSVAALWQICSVGAVGLSLEVSSLFSNVIITFAMPLVPVFAVASFEQEISGAKLVSMVLAIWGFVSYAYQHYIDEGRAVTKADGDEVTGVPKIASAE